VPDVRVLWLDAHGDFNTPRTTTSGYLGGMCLAGACGRWDSGFDGRFDPAEVIMVGVRDLDAGERAELDLAGVARVERFAQVADAVDGADVYVHVDLDVLDVGLSLETVQAVVTLVGEWLVVRAAAVLGYDPDVDSDGSVARAAVEVAAAAANAGISRA
jgi:arginase family enzyme